MNLRTSVLINRQVPEFVREDYPLFIEFLEAYYEFLESKQGIKYNDLLVESENALHNFDVDISIDKFESHFFNIFAPYITHEMVSDKAFFIKNVLNLYQAKGTEKSVKFLFKLIYGKDAEIIYPKNNILIASDGKWIKDNILKIDRHVATFYVGDGITTEFNYLPCRCPFSNHLISSSINVYVDNVLQVQNVDYIVLPSYLKVIFNTAPSEDSVLEFFYEHFDQTLFVNRKFIGVSSGASVISEKVFPRLINNEITYEIYVDPKTLIGQFQIGEYVTTKIFVNDQLIDVRCRTLSTLRSIVITDSGAYYNIGDPVLISAPNATRVPSAVVSDVYRGQINDVFITEGGSGFDANGRVYILDAEGNKIGTPYVDIMISSVLGSDAIDTANSFTIFSDIIADIDPANTTISAADYQLSGYYSGNANTIIAQALGNTSFTNIGKIIELNITEVNLSLQDSPVLDAEPAKLILGNNVVTINTFGSLGKLAVVNPGINYSVGDELSFANKPFSWGVGAEAEIVSVGNAGEIQLAKFVPSKIAGTANGSTSTVTVIGTATDFTTDLYVGCRIKINGEDKIVNEINSNTSMNVNSVFSSSFQNKPVRLYGKYLIGGQGYTQDLLPDVTINSATGSNGEIRVVSIMGDGEILSPEYVASNKFGGISKISIVDFGSGIKSVPRIDLSESGDGTAKASAELIPSYIIGEGRWKNSDGRISLSEIRLQDRRYYHNYSYVVSSEIEFTKYKKMLLDLFHPTGTICYGQINRRSDVDTNIDIDIESTITSIDQ